MQNNHSCKGFTLIEILVALSIISVTIGIGFIANDGIGKNIKRIEKRSYAHIIANETIKKYRISTTEDKKNLNKQTLHQFNSKWIVEIEATDTDYKNLEKIAISISNEENLEILNTTHALVNHAR